MTADGQGLSLEAGMARSGMRYDELWLRQLGLGGNAGLLEVEAYVLGVLETDRYQHDLLAQALNECFLERGENHPVAYRSMPAVD